MILAGVAAGQTTVLQMETRRVVLPVTVLDKKTKQSVTSLTAEDFTVTDDGQPVRITHFRSPEAARPLAIYLLLRNDRVDQKTLPHIERGLTDALQTLPQTAKVAVASYSMTDIAIWQPLTLDRNEVLAAIHRVVTANPDLAAEKHKSNDATKKTNGNEASANNATTPANGDGPATEQPISNSQAMKNLIKHYDFGSSGGLEMVEADWSAKPQAGYQPAVVVLDDEMSFCYTWRATHLHNELLRSAITLDELTEERSKLFTALVDYTKVVAPAGIPLSPGGAMFRYRYETYLAKASGGEVLAAGKMGYGSAFQKLFNDLSRAYEIEFEPTARDRDGKLHKVEVTLAGSKTVNPEKYRVMARDHYFAGMPQTAVEKLKQSGKSNDSGKDAETPGP